MLAWTSDRSAQGILMTKAVPRFRVLGFRPLRSGFLGLRELSDVGFGKVG